MENKLEITKEEAGFIRAAFIAFERNARSDEPHGSYSDEYGNLKKKVLDFIK